MKNLITLIFALILLVGCGKQGGKSEEPGSEDSRIQAQTRGEIQYEYEVESLDESGLKQLIARRNGKLLFLNLWATWCASCREEFPDLIKLVEQYSNSDVEFVGLSVDYPDEIEAKIIPFLKMNPVNFKIYVQDFKDEEDLIQFLNKDWSGAIPATFIFDSDGIQQAFLPEVRSYEEFKQELDRLKNRK